MISSKFKLLYFIIICVFSSQIINAQLSASFHTNANLSKVGLGYDLNENLWGEIRLYSSTTIENITPEIVLNYNITNREFVESYLGGGVVLNTFNGILAQAGFQIKPFENLKNFRFFIEAQPQYNWHYEDFYFNAYGGMRYKFN